MAELHIPIALKDQTKAFLNGREVPQEDWDTPVVPGDIVRVVIFAGGGGGGKGKSIIAMVLSIVVAIAAFFLGGPIAGALGFSKGTAAFTVAKAVASAVITIIGNLIIAALFPPPQISFGGEQSEKYYRLSGVSNRADPYGLVPRVYGKIRMFPRVAASPYTDYDGQNSILYAVFDFGYGPLQVDDIRLGEEPLENFEGVDYRIWPNFQSGDALEIVPETIGTAGAARELAKDVAETFTSEEGVIGMDLDIIMQRGLYSANGTGSKTVWWKMEYREFGSGDPWVSIHKAPQVIKRGGIIMNEIDNLTGTIAPDLKENAVAYSQFDVDGTVYVVRHVSLLQASGAPVYPADAAEANIAYQWGAALAISAKCTLTETQTGAIRFSWSLSKWDGDPLPYRPDTVTYTNPPESQAGHVYYGIVRVGADGAWHVSPIVGVNEQTGGAAPGSTDEAYREFLLTSSGTITDSGLWSVTAKSREPYVIRAGFRETEAKQWEIQATRVKTAETESIEEQDQMTVGLIRSVSGKQSLNFTHPHTIMEIEIKASEQLQGQVDNLNAVVTSILPYYDGTDWSNTKETQNPAWIIADILTGTANPKPMSKDRLIAADFLELADYADETDGINQGGARYEVGLVVENDHTTLEIAKQVAAIARADITLRDGLFSVIWEKTQTVPTQMFTPRNSWGMSGRILHADQPHGLRMRYQERDAEYVLEEVIAYSPGYNADGSGGNQAATILHEADAFGCTHRGQAWRLGTYLLAVARLRPEQFTISVDVEHLACQRGDYVHYVHDVPQIGGQAVRITEIDNEHTYIRVDEPIDEVASDNVIIRRQDGVFVEFSPASISEGGLRLNGAIPTGVVKGDLAAYGLINQEVGDYIVKTIEPGPDLTATLTLVDLVPELVTVDETGAPDAYTAQIHRDAVYVKPSEPTNLTAAQISGVYDERVEISAIQLSWTEPTVGAARVVEYEIWLDLYDATAGEYMTPEKIGRVNSMGYLHTRDVNPLNPGAALDILHRFRVYSVSSRGARSLNYASATITPTRDTTAPTAPTGASLVENTVRGARTLSWSLATPSEDHDGFQITIDAADARVVGAGDRVAVLTDIPDEGSHTVTVKSIDTLGNLSSALTYTLTPLAEASPVITENITYLNRLPRNRVNASWSAVGAETYYEVSWTIAKAGETPITGSATTSGTDMDIAVLDQISTGATVTVWVVPVLADGARPAKGSGTQHVLAGDTAPPPTPVPVVTENTVRGDRQVTFGITQPSDMSHFEVLVDGTVVTTAIAGATEVDFTVPLAGSHTITVKAYDTSGNVSSGNVSITPRPAVSGLTATESLRLDSRVYRSDIDLAWTEDASAAYYEVWRDDGAEWTLLGTTTTESWTDENVSNGQTQIEPSIFTDPVVHGAGVTHTYTVIAVGSDGGRLATGVAAEASETAEGDRTAPPDVSEFTVEETDDGLRRFHWDADSFTAVGDLAGFQIRWSSDPNTTFASATLLSQSLLPRPPYEIRAFPAGLVIVLIKAVDTVGNVSANAAVIKFNLGDRLPENLLKTEDHDPSWTGWVISGAVDNDDEIVTESLGDQFYIDGGASPMYTADANLMYSSTFGTVEYVADLDGDDGGILTLTAKARGPISLYHLGSQGAGYQDEGEFTAVGNWIVGSWSITNDVASISAASGAQAIYQTVTGLTIGTEYAIEYFTNSVSGADLQLIIDDDTVAYNTEIDALGSGPGHRWDFDGDLVDSGGAATGVNGSVGAGAASYTTSIIDNYTGQAIDIDADRIDIAETNLEFDSANTQLDILVWLNIDTIDATKRTVFEAGDTNTGFHIEVDLVSGVPTLHWTVWDGSGANLDTLSQRLPAGKTWCIVCTMDCTAGTMAIWVNGRKLAEKTGGLNIGSGHDGLGGDCGVGGVNGSTRHYDDTTTVASGTGLDGRVQYLAIWTDDPLSDAEIRVAYAAGAQRFALAADQKTGRHRMLFTAIDTSHKVELEIGDGGSVEVENLFVFDTAWVPWGSPVKIPVGDNRIRALVGASANLSTLYELQSQIDVPHLAETLNDVSISASGTRLSPTKTFASIEAVSIVLQDDAGTAVTAKVIDRSVSLGPLIECYNSSGTKVSGTVDAIIMGY